MLPPSPSRRLPFGKASNGRQHSRFTTFTQSLLHGGPQLEARHTTQMLTARRHDTSITQKSFHSSKTRHISGSGPARVKCRRGNGGRWIVGDAFFRIQLKKYVQGQFEGHTGFTTLAFTVSTPSFFSLKIYDSHQLRGI